jgi:gliding motility-associated-like protein
MNNLLRYLFLFGLIAQGSTAFATRYFVNSTLGNNSNTATEARNPATPWRSINFAIQNASVAAGDTIEIAAGTYSENVDVRKSVYLRGNLGTGAKPVINGAGIGSPLWIANVHRPNVTINNVTLEVNQTNNIYGILADSIGRFNNLQVLNTNITSGGAGTRGCSVFASIGIFAGTQGFLATDRLTVKGCYIGPRNPNTNCIFGRGIRTFGTNLTVGGAGIDSNSITGTYAIQTGNPNGGPCVIENNTLNGIGVEINNPTYVPAGFSDQHRIINNRFGTFLTENTLTQLEIKESIVAGASIRVTGNTFRGFNQYGVFSTRSRNVTVSNNTFTPAENSVGYVCVGVNTKQQTSNPNQGAIQNNIILQGNTFNGNFFGNGTGIGFFNHNSGLAIPFEGTVIGGAGTLANRFESKLTRFFDLDASTGNSNSWIGGTWSSSPVTVMAPVSQNFDISGNQFDLGTGFLATADLTPAQLFSLEDKISHKTDFGSLGFVTIIPNQSFVTANTFLSPSTLTSSVSRAMLSLTDGGIVNFNFGNFSTENVTLDKSLTFTGAITLQLNSLIMNGAGKVLVQQLPITTNGITLTNGIIDSRARLAINNAASISGGSANSFIRTIGTSNVAVSGLNSTTRLLPIGSVSGYAPLNISDQANSNDVFSFRVAAANAVNQFTPNLPSSVIRFVTHNWFINEATAGGSDLRVRFNWSASQIQGGSLVAPAFTSFNAIGATSLTETPATLTGNFVQANIPGSGTFLVYSSSRPVADRYYVNNAAGSDGNTLTQASNITTPWRSISNALALVNDYDTIEVASTGTPYAGKLTITKKVYLEGRSNAGVKPVLTTTTDQEVIFISDSNITIDNFRINVNQGNTLYGIRASTLYHDLAVEDCQIISNGTSYVFGSMGVLLEGFNKNNISFKRNYLGPDPTLPISNFPNLGVFGRGLRIRGNYGVIGGDNPADSNRIVTFYGIQMSDITGGRLLIKNNSLLGQGLEINIADADCPEILVENNRFNSGSPDNIAALIEIKGSTNRVPINIRNNTLTNFRTFGIYSTRSNQVTISNNIFTPEVGQRNYISVGVNTAYRTANVFPDAPFLNGIKVQTNTFNSSGAFGGSAVQLYNYDASAATPFDSVIIGGASTLANTFSSGIRNWVALDTLSGSSASDPLFGTLRPTLARPVTGTFDASENLFQISPTRTVRPAAMTDAELFVVENRMQHLSDYDSLGIVSIKPNNIYVSDSSFLTGFTTRPSLARVGQGISDGFTVNTLPISFNESVTVSNTITLKQLTNRPVTVNSLTMNGANKTLTLNQNLVISNALNLNGANGGYINPLTNAVVLGGSAVVNGGSAISYVIADGGGRLAKLNIGSNPFTFAIGTSGPLASYAPVTFDDVNNTNDSISASVVSRTSITQFTPQILPSSVQGFANFQWFINEGVVGGSNARLTFGWQANRVTNGPLNVDGAILNFGAGAWNRTDAAFNGNSLGADGYTSFTSFAVVKDPSEVLINVSVSDTVLCQNEQVTVTINVSRDLDPTNVFTVQLSNALGEFTAPVVLGTLTSITSGSVIVTIPASQIAGEGYKIRVLASSPFTVSELTVPSLSINGTPATPVVVASGPINFCIGDNVTLTAPAGPGLTYRWSDGSTTQAITVNRAASFRVAVTSAAGCTSDSSIAVVTGVTDPGPAPVVTVTGSTIICIGDSVILEGPAGATYIWSTGATTRRIVARTAGDYSLRTIVGTCTTAASNLVTVTPAVVPAAPAITIVNGRPTTFCTGDSVQLEGPAAATSYIWSTGATTQRITLTSSNAGVTLRVKLAADGCTSDVSVAVPVTVNPIPDQPVITVTTDSVFCQGSSATLQGPTGAATYLWSGPAALPSAETVDATVSGFYTLRVVNASGCTSLVSSSVSVRAVPLPAQPLINNTRPLTFCEGDFTTLQGPVGATRYIWSNGASTQSIDVNSAATITLVVTNAEGCESPVSAPVAVVVNPTPTAPTISAIRPLSFCVGDSTILEGPAGAGAYQWSNGETTQRIVVKTTSAITLRITNALGCQSPESVIANVLANTVTQATITTSTGNNFVCEGGTLDLTASAGATFLWSNGATTQATTINAGGTFSVVVTDVNGCVSTSLPLTIIASPAPILTATEDTFRIAANTDRTVTVSASPAGNYSYLWTPAFGIDNPTSGTVNINTDQTQNYTVTVTNNTSGCSATIPILVIVSKEVYVPNMFSPNDDKVNDRLLVYGYGVRTLKLRIYDRFGRTVFESSDVPFIQNVGWDGKSDGKDLPSDTYFYSISGTLENGDAIKVLGKNNGSIFLNR